MMGKKERVTVAENLFWAYAKLAMAHAAVDAGVAKYGVRHFQVRARLYAGLRKGEMQVGSILDDERLKLTMARCCAYCGAEGALTLDHLVPRVAGGADSGDNAVWACRSCNSSKGGRDFIRWWFERRDGFPPLMLVRRYLKLAIRHAEVKELLDRRLEDITREEFPFDLEPLREKFPPPSELELVKGSVDP